MADSEVTISSKLDEAITTLLGKTVDGIDSTVGFLEGQLPDYVQQLLIWHSMRSLMQTVGGIALLLASVAIIVWLIKLDNARDTHHKWDVEWLFPAVVLLIPTSVALCLINLTWLQIWVAPKVWLVEYAAKLVN